MLSMMHQAGYTQNLEPHKHDDPLFEAKILTWSRLALESPMKPLLWSLRTTLEVQWQLSLASSVPSQARPREHENPLFEAKILT